MSDYQYDPVQSYSRDLGIPITVEEASVLMAREPTSFDAWAPELDPDEEARHLRILREVAGRVALAHGLSTWEASELVTLSTIGIGVEEYLRSLGRSDSNSTRRAEQAS